MNRGRELEAICVGVAAICLSTTASAKDAPAPSLSIDPIVARGLLAPIDDARAASSYRLDPGLEPTGGQRAKLSVDVGKATLFAITGRIKRDPAPVGPLDAGHALTLSPRHDSSKVYGGGLTTSFRGVDLSATYQYSKIHADQGDSEAAQSTLGRSHSVRATARFRFRL